LREPKPFFREQTQNWYLQLGKRQIPLGKDNEAAWEEYHKLMGKRTEGVPLGNRQRGPASQSVSIPCAIGFVRSECFSGMIPPASIAPEESRMIQMNVTAEEQQSLPYERFHHPDRRIQVKMEVL
jgi:hypothetical protein